MRITRTDIREAIGWDRGYGRTSTSWSTAQAAVIDDAVKRGVPRFYYPSAVAIPGNPAYVHSWSFLKLTGTLTCVADQGEYDLPENFGQMIGKLTFAPGYAYTPVEQVSEAMIRARRELNTGSGIPSMAAILWKPTDGAAFQAAQLMLEPAPDAAYVLEYRYAVLPDAMASDRPYPLSTDPEAECLLESCLAVAEELTDGRGPHYAAFMEQLVACILRDAQRAPESLGLSRPTTGVLSRHGDDPARTVTYTP